MLDKWDSSLKCLPPERLAEMATRLARPLVFIHGPFDRLDVRHVVDLEHASSRGACLVVALDADAASQAPPSCLPALDGAGPAPGLHDRARVIAALGCVAWVTWYEGGSPDALLAALKPDVTVVPDGAVAERQDDAPLAELRLIEDVGPIDIARASPPAQPGPTLT